MARAFATDRTLQSAVSATANGDNLSVVGLSTVAFQVTGTFVATVTFEGTIDASNWVSVLARNVATGAVATTATAAGIFVTACTGLSLMRARVTWTSGTSVTVIALAQAVGMGDAAYAKRDSSITTPTSYNVTLTTADHEYSQALPANARFFEFQCRTEHDVRFAFAADKVATPTAPYHTLKAGDYYYSPQIAQGASPSTLYLASATAGVIVEIIAWI